MLSQKGTGVTRLPLEVYIGQPRHSSFPPAYTFSSKRISSRSIFLCILGSLLVKLGPLLGILLRNPSLERIIRVRLNEQLAHGGQDSSHFGRGLPLVRFEETDADVSLGVAGDVGVVDASEEGDFGRGEGVGWG